MTPQRRFFGPARCGGLRLHVAAILPTSLDSATSAGYRRRLAVPCALGAVPEVSEAPANSTTEHPSSTATGVTSAWSASPHGVTRSRCDHGRLPSAKLLQSGGGDEPARALALAADLLLTQESPDGLHVPARQLRSFRRGVADVTNGVGRVRHAQIISNYRYLQRKIVVTNVCFMGY